MLDPEYAAEAAACVGEEANYLMRSLDSALGRQLPAQAQVDEAMQQLPRFRNREGSLALTSVQNAASTTAAHSWWANFGSTLAELQRAAVRILAQPASACASERNWSSYGFVHDIKRNRLTPDRAQDLLAWVFTNFKVKDAVTAAKSPAFVPWADEDSDDDAPQPAGPSTQQDPEVQRAAAEQQAVDSDDDEDDTPLAELWRACTAEQGHAAAFRRLRVD